MSRTERIQAPVKNELAEFQSHFKSAMRTDVALLDRIMRYIIKRKGKQMRPLFVFLSAQTVAGEQPKLGERSHIAASLIAASQLAAAAVSHIAAFAPALSAAKPSATAGATASPTAAVRSASIGPVLGRRRLGHH